jgi:hypothetical protein
MINQRSKPIARHARGDARGWAESVEHAFSGEPDEGCGLHVAGAAGAVEGLPGCAGRGVADGDAVRRVKPARGGRIGVAAGVFILLFRNVGVGRL